MTPTNELRWVIAYRFYPWMPDPADVPVLQQKWVQHHVPAGHTEAPFEWRDVPVVNEQGESHA